MMRRCELWNYKTLKINFKFIIYLFVKSKNNKKLFHL